MTDELARLEREIAEAEARFRVMYHCSMKREWLTVPEYQRYLKAADELGKSLRYLQLRGLLERHPERPELVRFVEKEHE